MTTSRYDGLGREITNTESTQSGLPALSAYEPGGHLVAEWEGGLPSYTDERATRHLLPDGSPAYAAAGRLLRTTEPGSTAPSIQTYTADGHVARQTLPDGTYTDYLYDAAGNQTQSTRSNGGVSSAVYDLGGRVTSATDENNLTTSFTYDCLSRQLSAGAGGAPASTKTYNTFGWLLREVEADGRVTTFAYDPAGRTLGETVAGETTTSTYDQAGNLTRQVDPAGGWLDLEYDYFARTTRELQTLPGTPRVVVRDTLAAYDGLGRPLTWTDDPVDIDGTAAYPLNTPAATTAVFSVGTAGTDLVETTLTVGADGLETTRLSIVTSTPQVPNLLRTVTARDAGLRVTGATLATGQPWWPGSTKADRRGRKWSTASWSFKRSTRVWFTEGPVPVPFKMTAYSFTVQQKWQWGPAGGRVTRHSNETIYGWNTATASFTAGDNLSLWERKYIYKGVSENYTYLRDKWDYKSHALTIVRGKVERWKTTLSGQLLLRREGTEFPTIEFHIRPYGSYKRVRYVIVYDK